MTLAVMILALAMQQYTQWPSCSIGDAHTAPATEEGCKKVGGTFHPGRLANYHGGKEPMDVPAVHLHACSLTSKEIEDGYCCGSEPGARQTSCPAYSPGIYTCADVTRILLTSEDGKKHCILFPK